SIPVNAGIGVRLVVVLARGVVFAQDAAGAVVVEVLAAAARVARGDEVAEVVVLVAPRLDVGGIRGRLWGKTRCRVRIDVEDHASQAVVAHPAGHRVTRARLDSRDADGLAGGEVLRLDVALLHRAVIAESFGGARGAPVAVFAFARVASLVGTRREVGCVPKVRAEGVV